MLVYLNDVTDSETSAQPLTPPAGAGETSFPKLNLKVNPKLGTALVFNDCLDDGAADDRTLHGGEPPRDGALKYAINIWIRANTFEQGGGEQGAQPELVSVRAEAEQAKEAKAEAGGEARAKAEVPVEAGLAAQRSSAPRPWWQISG
mmetsp:Transcript_11750/g.29761  ORF Transcript_11750/g.29761 Transcript_11750/m.29761 type:complete len:147 (+) Transcript_11750:397-837(+)